MKTVTIFMRDSFTLQLYLHILDDCLLLLQKPLLDFLWLLSFFKMYYWTWILKNIYGSLRWVLKYFSKGDALRALCSLTCKGIFSFELAFRFLNKTHFPAAIFVFKVQWKTLDCSLVCCVVFNFCMLILELKLCPDALTEADNWNVSVQCSF